MVTEVMEAAGSLTKNNILLIPIYNDWEALSFLLRKLDGSLLTVEGNIDVVIIDDGSSLDPSSFLSSIPDFHRIDRIEMLRLGRNLGHQKAIAIGLSYVEEHFDFNALVIMDGDGEDDPDDIVKLLTEMKVRGDKEIIFASREKHSDGFIFRMFYQLFKSLCLLLTGKRLDFGNFSVIPRSLLERLTVVAELWSNYPASVLKARLPNHRIPIERKRRLKGQSQMNFIALVMHGLSALSVFGEEIGLRALVATMLIITMSFLGIIAVMVIKMFTSLAVPGWASYVVASFFAILLQSLTLSLFFIFMILHSRDYYNFIPRRDYRYFILSSKAVFLREVKNQ